MFEIAIHLVLIALVVIDIFVTIGVYFKKQSHKRGDYYEDSL